MTDLQRQVSGHESRFRSSRCSMSFRDSVSACSWGRCRSTSRTTSQAP